MPVVVDHFVFSDAPEPGQLVLKAHGGEHRVVVRGQKELDQQIFGVLPTGELLKESVKNRRGKTIIERQCSHILCLIRVESFHTPSFVLDEISQGISDE